MFISICIVKYLSQEGGVFEKRDRNYWTEQYFLSKVILLKYLFVYF